MSCSGRSLATTTVRPRGGWLALATLALLAACGESQPDAPRPELVTPGQGASDRDTDVVITGSGFNPLVRVDYNDRRRSVVSTAFSAHLGQHALQQVEYRDSARMTARVPAGLPPGLYELTVVDPRGRSGTLPGAFEVLTPGDGGPETAPDGGLDGDVAVPDLPVPDAPPRLVSTVAGNGQAGFADGPGASAQFFNPRGVAASGGKVYVADYANHRVRAISNGQVTTLAGTGAQGRADGPAAGATFNFPAAVATDNAGVVYVADSANNVIRKIAAGVVSTLAGDGTKGFADGPAASAQFDSPQGIAQVAGTVYVVDTENHRIRKIEAGVVSTVAGDGTKGFADGPVATARFSSPTGITVSGTTIYIADTGNQRIRAIVGNTVSTVAGTGAQGSADGPALGGATFWDPRDVAVSGTQVLVADQNNHRIRVIEQGTVTTLTGSFLGFKDGQLSVAQFYYPVALAVDSTGQMLYVADQSNQRIRAIEL